MIASQVVAEDYMFPGRHQIQMVDPDGRLRPESEQGTEPGHEYPLPGDEELIAAFEQLVVGRRARKRLVKIPLSTVEERQRPEFGARPAGPHGRLPFQPRPGGLAGGRRPLPFRKRLDVPHAPRRGRRDGPESGPRAGATSHEALNFAAVFHLPVIFFVQNNKYAISVPLAHQSVAPSLAHKAVGYGMAGERVDGNDVVAPHAVLDRAVKLAREGSGPLLVEAHTYRMQATPMPTTTRAPGKEIDDGQHLPRGEGQLAVSLCPRWAIWIAGAEADRRGAVTISVT